MRSTTRPRAQREARTVYSYMDSPVGRLLLAGDGHHLTVIEFCAGRRARGVARNWRRDDAAFGQVQAQLDDYFAGERRAFDLPLAPATTPFQARVLAVLTTIPYGETRSYRDIALCLGNAAAARAVGAANGSNPIPIVIPCHRVLGSDGSLTGFGGGLDAKRYLLELEANHSGLFANG